jgi:hypothetical protein
VNRLIPGISRQTPHRLAPILACALLIFVAQGCGKDSSSPTNPGGGGGNATTMIGVMINSSENGKLTVSLSTATLSPPPGAYAARSVVTASASYQPIGGSMVTMTGTYDTDTDTLKLAGGGYSVSAFIEEDGMPPSTVGQYDGPNGIGLFGALSTEGASTEPPVLCGTYQSSTGPEAGNLGILVNDTQFGGITFSSNTASFIPLEGTVSGAGTTKTLSGEGVEAPDSLSISGTYNSVSGQASGTWVYTNLGTMVTDSGTWSAELCP